MDGHHHGLMTYTEAFARLVDGGWAKTAEHVNHDGDGRVCFVMETWARDGFDGREWMAVDCAPYPGQGLNRWHLLGPYTYDPRALRSDEAWAKYGPGSAG